MDLLRTQKIRYLVSIYRDMARPFGQQKEQRLVLIGNVINVLSEESVSAQRNEVNMWPLNHRIVLSRIHIIHIADRAATTRTESSYKRIGWQQC